MGFIILFAICCALVILVMLGFVVYTIATGQFHALPKEIIITAIPSLILFLMFKFCKNSKNKVSKKNVQEKTSSTSNESKKTTNILYNCLPAYYLFNIPLAYSYDYVKVCIIKGQEPDITKLQIGMEVELKQEPNNQYDNKAIAILANDEKIGYMYKGKLKDMANDFINDMKSYVFGYITEIKNNEIYIVGLHISPYEHGNIFNKDPLRDRKLLLNRREINKLIVMTKQKGYSLVPLSMYFKGSLVKVELGVGKGKKLYDKREDIAKKDAERRMLQHLKNQ